MPNLSAKLLDWAIARMRLVHVTTVPISLAFLRGQLGYMKEHGFDVAVVSSPGEPLDEFGAEQGVETVAVEMPRKITPLRDLRALVRLGHALRRIRPTIVHAHTPKGGLLGMLGALIARAPVRLYHMRGLPMQTAVGHRRYLLRWSERIACLAAHEVLCVSHSLREIAIEERICPPHKIKVLAEGSGNGVDCDRRFNPALHAASRIDTRKRYGIPPDAIVIGFVGRLVRDKGIVELLDAWREVSQFERVHLMIVGMLEERDAIPGDAAAALQTDARIHWKGVDWNTPPLYAAMDIVVLPTYREGFPNVPLEAAAMQLPIVATRIAGCTDAIDDGVTGLLVPPRDATALAAALWRYIDDAELRRAHGRAGRDRVTRMFRQERIWQALHDEYQRLVEERV
jgi:glycosyltransferase involved in cell wall biosynthesis